MPNPRVSFRCPSEIYAKLPTDERERSKYILDLIRKDLAANDPQAQVLKLQQQMEQLQAAMAAMTRLSNG